jgi:hypothetical protein
VFLSVGVEYEYTPFAHWNKVYQPTNPPGEKMAKRGAAGGCRSDRLHEKGTETQDPVPNDGNAACIRL